MALNLLGRPPAGEEIRGQRIRPSFGSIFEGLILDIKTLISQELRLAKHEIQQELGKTKAAVVSMAAGMGLAAVGGVLLVIMLVHVLNALGLPLWASYGIIGGLCAGGGVFLLYSGKKTAADIHVMPEKTIKTIKENATWVKEQIRSSKI